MTGYVILNTDLDRYYARPNLRHLSQYTADLAKAAYYDTLDKAQQEILCGSDECVVSIDSLIKTGGLHR